MVDLKQAIASPVPTAAVATSTAAGGDSGGPGAAPGSTLELELHLDHPDGQVANPRVILEQLFRMTPEEQARVRVIRTALLDEEGKPVSLA